MSYSEPGPVMARLNDIDKDLAERQNPYEDAASIKANLTREWERRLARCRVTAKGNDADSRKAQALLDAIGQDDLYERLMVAEGAYAGCQAAIKVMETRVSIGQSILKALGRG